MHAKSDSTAEISMHSSINWGKFILGLECAFKVQCLLTCTCWMTPWPHAIWLTRSTRTTCRSQVPCVTGVSDRVPKSGAGVVSLSIWQEARGTTVHSYIVDKETWNRTTWCIVDKVRLAIVTSVRSIHTHSVDVLRLNIWREYCPKLIMCNK